MSDAENNYPPATEAKRDSSGALNVAEILGLLITHIRILVAGFLGFAVTVAVISLLMPNVYRGEATISPAVVDQDARLQIPGIEGLASLAGITMPGSGDVDENLAVLRSRDFVWRFIREYDLMPILFEDEWDKVNAGWIDPDPENHPTDWDAYRLFTRKIFGVNKDAKTGLVRVSIEWHDPKLAAAWANRIIDLLNLHLRTIAINRSEKSLQYLYQELEGIKVAEMRQTLYQLIEKEQRTAMIVNTQKEYAFRVLDPAVAPDKKIRPKRALLTVLAGVLGFLLAAGFVIFRHGYGTPDAGR